MADIDIISTNPTTLLEDFQLAYYNQIGSRMQIGSEEYILSSVFTYVLALYAALVNNSYKNQCIDTASGVFLDNIANKYGLSRTPEVYSNPWFEGFFYFNPDSVIYGRAYIQNALSITVGGHVYTNENAISSATRNRKIRFVCIESHQDYLSKTELISALKEVEDSSGNKVFVSTYLYNHELSEMQDTANKLSDDELRDYIKTNKQRYINGVARSFEALAKSSSKDIVDARVRVQGDQGFTAGKVDLYCKPFSYVFHDNYENLIRAIDIPKVESIITEQNIAVIGQTVEVFNATKITDARRYVFYVPEAYNSIENEYLYEAKYHAVRGYLNNTLKINDSYIPSMLVTLMTKSLSEISNDPTEFGLAPEDEEYQTFDKYKDLTVLGLESLSDYTRHASNPISYIYLGEGEIKLKFI